MRRKISFVFFLITELTVFPLRSLWADSLAKRSNLYSIHELNREDVDFGTYEVEAYVLKRGSNYLLVSDENGPWRKHDLNDHELIVFVDNPNDFSIGSQYKCLIQVLDVKSTQQKLNNIKLVYFEKIVDKVDDLVLEEKE